MKKTNLIIYAEGKIKRTLFIENDELYMLFNGKYWNFTKGEVSFYWVMDKTNNKYFSVNFENLNTIKQEITNYVKGF